MQIFPLTSYLYPGQDIKAKNLDTNRKTTNLTGFFKLLHTLSKTENRFGLYIQLRQSRKILGHRASLEHQQLNLVTHKIAGALFW